MARNRAKAEKRILATISMIDKSGINTKLTKDFFASMNDQQFHDYMMAIKEKRDYVSIVMDNMGKTKITTENNLDVAAFLGVKLFQRIWLTDPATGMEYLTPLEYLVIHLPVRRQIQTLLNKISIPEDNKHVDELTDQPTGASKGSAVSFPELLVMYSSGAEKAIEEFIRFRGGDLKLMNDFDKQIHETGGASMEALSNVSRSRVKSTKVLSTILTAMHIKNNF